MNNFNKIPSSQNLVAFSVLPPLCEGFLGTHNQKRDFMAIDVMLILYDFRKVTPSYVDGQR
jgi:hypothetical protein